MKTRRTSIRENTAWGRGRGLQFPPRSPPWDFTTAPFCTNVGQEQKGKREIREGSEAEHLFVKGVGFFFFDKFCVTELVIFRGRVCFLRDVVQLKSGAAGCENGFITFFQKVPLLARAARELLFSPTACGTLRKHVTKPFPHPAAPDCTILDYNQKIDELETFASDW